MGVEIDRSYSKVFRHTANDAGRRPPVSRDSSANLRDTVLGLLSRELVEDQLSAAVPPRIEEQQPLQLQLPEL